VCRSEVTLIYIDESHLHKDLDGGYTWSEKGRRAWRVSTTPGLSELLNWLGAYDFGHGRCLIWEDGPCDGNAPCHFLERVARWRAGPPEKVVVIWDNAPCHVARVVTGHAEELGIELVFLPGYSPCPYPQFRASGAEMRGSLRPPHQLELLPAVPDRDPARIAVVLPPQEPSEHGQLAIEAAGVQRRRPAEPAGELQQAHVSRRHDLDGRPVRYAALVSAQASICPGMLAVGSAAIRAATRISRSAHRRSPRSARPNCSRPAAGVDLERVHALVVSPIRWRSSRPCLIAWPRVRLSIRSPRRGKAHWNLAARS